MECCNQLLEKIQIKILKSILFVKLFGHVQGFQVLDLGSENTKSSFHLVDHFRHAICIDRKGKDSEDHLKRFRPAHGGKTTWREKILTATDGAAFFNYILEANLTSKEREILAECNDCALMIYSLPLMVGSGGTMMWLQLNNIVKKTRWLNGRLAYVPKLFLSVSGAYLMGQYNYWAGQDCPRRFLDKIPSSHASLVLRKRFPHPNSDLDHLGGVLSGHQGKQFSSTIDRLVALTTSENKYIHDERYDMFNWDIKPATIEDILHSEVKRGRLKIVVEHG